jgi:competence protein ComEA
MTAKVSWFWVSVTIALVVIIILGGVLAWSKYRRGVAIDISMALAPEPEGNVYIGEGVAMPGVYPFTSDDTISTLLGAAGGARTGADLESLRLDIPMGGAGEQPQRVDINRAEVWLLQALPGIGEILAKRIVEYREQNGPFRSPVELTKVAGIGKDTYERIKDLITVADH